MELRDESNDAEMLQALLSGMLLYMQAQLIVMFPDSIQTCVIIVMRHLNMLYASRLWIR